MSLYEQHTANGAHVALEQVPEAIPQRGILGRAVGRIFHGQNRQKEPLPKNSPNIDRELIEAYKTDPEIQRTIDGIISHYGQNLDLLIDVMNEVAHDQPDLNNPLNIFSRVLDIYSKHGLIDLLPIIDNETTQKGKVLTRSLFEGLDLQISIANILSDSAFFTKALDIADYPHRLTQLKKAVLHAQGKFETSRGVLRFVKPVISKI